MAFLRVEGFFVFLYGKVVVTLQWISRETKRSLVSKKHYMFVIYDSITY